MSEPQPIRSAPQVYVIAGLSEYEAIVRRWTWPRNTHPGECVLEIPGVSPESFSWPGDQYIAVKIEATLVFRGIIVDVDRALSGDRNAVMIHALGPRHVLTGIPSNLYFVGDLAAADKSPGDKPGGWPGIGRDLVFNRDGQPNRSPSKTANDIYTFDRTPDATYWTARNILYFLFYWFIDTGILRLKASYLGIPYDTPLGEVDCTDSHINAAIHRVTAQVGGTWTIYHDWDADDNPASYYLPVHPDIDPAYNITVNVDTSDTDTDPDKWTAGSISVRESVRQSADRVQVISHPWVVETQYSDDQADPLLECITSGIPEDYICYFRTNPENYFANDVGADLAADAPPKPWRRYLVTRRASDGSYVTGGNDYISGSSKEGDPIPCSLALWISNDSGSTKYRVINGIDIDYDLARLRVRKQVTVYGDTMDQADTLVLSDASKVSVYFTVATVLPYGMVSRTPSDKEYLTHHRARSISRTDLIPTYRGNSVLPDPSTAAPHDTVTVGAGSVYDDPKTRLDYYRDKIYNSRPNRQQSVQIRLHQIPPVAIGWGVSLSPAFDGIDNLRVIDLEYDMQQYDTIVTAANNLGVQQ